MRPSSFPLPFATLVLSALHLLFLDSSCQKCAQLTVVSSFPFCSLPLSYFHWINHILNLSFLIPSLDLLSSDLCCLENPTFEVLILGEESCLPTLHFLNYCPKKHSPGSHWRCPESRVCFQDHHGELMWLAYPGYLSGTVSESSICQAPALTSLSWYLPFSKCLLLHTMLLLWYTNHNFPFTTTIS